MKKFISLLLAVMMLLSVIAMGTISSSAASNSSTPFKQGKIVACGKYLFSLVYRDGDSTKCLYRTSKSGKSKKLITKLASTQTDLFTYKSKVYYSADDKLMCYNAKTAKNSVFAETMNEPVGICTKGVITYSGVDGIILRKFDGGSKKIASEKCEFGGANKSYVFYTKSLSFNSSNHNEKIRLYRYSVSDGKKKAMGKFTIKEYASGAYGKIIDFHAFSKYCVFISGSYAGSMGDFTGSVYSMKADGTKIKKLKSSIDNELMPGKSCVYIKSKNSSGKPNTVYKINGKGKITKKTKDKSKLTIQATTEGNCSLTNKAAEYTGSGSSYNMYANKSVSAKAGKLVVKVKKLIKSSDPGDSFASCEVEDVTGNLALVCASVYSYENAIGWRPHTVRSVYYIVNVKTGKKVKI